MPAADNSPRSPEETWAGLGRTRWPMLIAPGGLLLLTWTLAGVDLLPGWVPSKSMFVFGPTTAAFIGGLFAASRAAGKRSLSKTERTSFVCMVAAQSIALATIAWVLAVTLASVLRLAG